MTLKLKNNYSVEVRISGLGNFTIDANTTVDAPVGYTEDEIISAIVPFPNIILLGGTFMTVHTYDTDGNNIADDADTVAIVNGRIDQHEIDYNHSDIEHLNRLALDEIIEEPVTITKNVDGSRVDSYTPDGSDMKPFKNVQSAIDSISDASNSKKYIVKVNSGVYNEDITFKPYVNITGSGKESVKIDGTHTGTFGTGGRLEIKDITIRGAITFDKPAGTVPGVSIWVDNAWLDSILANFKGATDYLQLVNNCMVQGNITHHSSHMLIRDSLVYGTITTDDQDLEYPDPVYGDSGTRDISGCGCNNISAAGNTWIEIHNSHVWGTLTSDGASCYLNYDVVSAPENPANIVSLNGGNISLMSRASSLSNDSSVTGDTVKDALNNCIEKNSVNGTFTTVDGKTITVVDGQITNIV